MTPAEVKNSLYQHCLEWLEHKIEIATKAMKDAQDSANSEEKSSAGDKFETGRAMSQIERDMFARQLAECVKQKQILLNTDSTQTFTKVLPGALVLTDVANYFISISAGNLSVEGIPYFAVSPDTPVAQLLLHKHPGDTVLWNGKKILLKEIQ